MDYFGPTRTKIKFGYQFFCSPFPQ